MADVLLARGFEVWIDARLDYGSQWPHEIQKQLDNCSAFIVIMSPRSYASEWVQSELQRAKRKLKPVFPLLLEGDEPWLSVESTQFYDVRGGKLPDERFFSAIEQVAFRGQPAVGTPAGGSQNASASRPPAVITGYALPIIGVVVIIILGLLAAPSLRNRFSPAPVTEEISPGTATEPIDSTVTPSSASLPTDAEITNTGDVPMVFVPAGKFTMGSDADDALAECQKYRSDCDRSWYEDEEPPHIVSLDAFHIDSYEVTNALYAACVNAGGCQMPTETGSATRSSYYGNPEFDNFPVIYVNWNMANTYCEWRGARLPTEAEWEKAARGTEGHTYPWGEELDGTYANYNNDIGDTTAVGNYETGKSPYGVYDMAGNVWEWVADRYLDTYYRNLPSSISNPLGPDSGRARVLRGGSWYDPADLIRTSVRLAEPNPVDNNFGIRCAMDANP